MNDILVTIGEALIDFIPDKRGCSFSDVTSFSPKIGGAPANVCAAYSRLGGKAKILTQLGDDPFGHKILKELSEFGIDTSCVSLTDKANTALAFVCLDETGNRTFSFYRKPSSDMLYAPENVREEYFDNAYALHFCSVDLGEFPMREAHRAAISIARNRGAIISFDPNLRFPLWKSRELLKKTVSEFILLADIVKISDEEIEFITGTTDIEKALPDLFKGNVKLVIYTCGSKGAYAFTKTAIAFSNGIDVNVVDTTGAGDGFIGSFLWKMNNMGIKSDEIKNLKPEELFECVDFSNKFCAKSVQKQGAINSYPKLNEIN